ncbi:Beta-glucosidase [Quillaja saponaria]|uniref:Beta-glucosidase n=1 Tax=Quillaja saponaria TaxID=32244 RepID=A0AAD7PD73_QUISA|nr:Beta-glucosidase [Quillaja saponaria]
MLKLFFVINLLALPAFSYDNFSRDDFPSDFVFGAGTSAYQVEGAADQDGRKPSIWDTFTHSGKIDRDNGDIASDVYHKYKDDVRLMAAMGLEAYRFSISWSRVIPDGKGPVNPKGLQYYNSLINELIRYGIKPHVTLHHYDLPQALEDEYGGWISKNIVNDFTAYADLCFRKFGDRVKYWTTINEPNVFVLGGYDSGFLPPGRCSPAFGDNCSRGNSTTEPYIAAHHILLAHASAARLYRKKYEDQQHGFIGINIFSYWFVPLTNTVEDITATERANDFYVGWFVNPLIFGDYPDIMKKNAGSRIPVFTEVESNLVKGSYDFLGVNHYNVLNVKDNPKSLQMEERDLVADMAVQLTSLPRDTPAFEFPVRPWGLQGLLEYLKKKYDNPPLFIHENGQRTRRNSSLIDWPRVKFLHGYIGATLDVLRNGSNVRGYFVWSFLDALELFDGYESSYGLYYVDHLDDSDLKRKPKLSAHWYSNFLKRKSMSSEGLIELLQNATIVSPAHSLL